MPEAGIVYANESGTAEVLQLSSLQPKRRKLFLFFRTDLKSRRNQVMKRIKIFDTTLRDGEQSPGCSMNLPEKI